MEHNCCNTAQDCKVCQSSLMFSKKIQSNLIKKSLNCGYNKRICEFIAIKYYLYK